MTPQELEDIKLLKLRNEEVTVFVEYVKYDLDGDGVEENLRVMVNREHHLYLGGVDIRDLSHKGLRPIDVTLYLPRINEPSGNRGLGVLEQVRELAMEIDALFNQITDANSLMVLRPGFYDPSGDLSPAALKLAPNKMTPVTRPRDNVFFPEFTVPTEKLVGMVQVVLEFVERLTAASEFVFGKEGEFAGGSGTATRTNTIIQSAATRHSIPIERGREGASRIVSTHLDLVQKNLSFGIESRVLGQKGQPLFGEGELGTPKDPTKGISGEFDAYLLPDESMGSKETERQLSQLLYTLLTQNIIVASDPAKLYKITADVLKAWGKDPILYLGPPTEIAGGFSANDEFTLILQGEFGRVRPSVTQNHLDHILQHQAQLNDPVIAFPPAPPSDLPLLGPFFCCAAAWATRAIISWWALISSVS